MIPARTWAEIMRTKGFPSIFLSVGFPLQFLDAPFVDERIIAGSSGVPVSERMTVMDRECLLSVTVPRLTHITAQPQ